MYQQVTVVGNLGNDPEMRYTQSGIPVTSFSLAANRTWVNQQGERQDKTTWFRVTAWRKLAETSSQYLTKGRQVLVIGEMEESSVWTDREGNNRASLELTAQTIKFIGNRGDGPVGGGASASSGADMQEAAPVSDEEIPF